MVRSVATLGCVALALVASASGSTQRDALIRPGVGIGKVRLGTTLAQVRAAWGRPQAVVTRTPKRGGRILELQYDFAAYIVTLRGHSRHERVVAVGTTLAKERLRQGVGVGSLERRLQRIFRDELHCERLPVGFAPRSSIPIIDRNERRCALGAKGEPQTVFTSRIRMQNAWDWHMPEDWPKQARVTEVVVRASGAD